MIPNKYNPDFCEEKPQVNIAVTAIFTCVFFIYLKPKFDDLFEYFGIHLFANKVYPIFLLVMTLVIFCVAARAVDKKGRIDVFLAAFVLMCFFVAVASFIHPGSGESGYLNSGQFMLGPAIKSWAFDWFPLIGVVGLIYAYYEDYCWELIWGFFAACCIYLLLNVISILIQEASFGAIDYLAFGFRNVTFRIAIPAFVCSLVIAIRLKRKYYLLPVVIYLISLFQIIGAYSATSFCAFIAVGVLALITMNKRTRKLLNAITYSVSYLIIAFFVVVFRIQNLLGPAISLVLHKDVTFTGRTLLWDQAFEKLSGLGFLIGYGNNYYWHTFEINNMFHKHAHNEILNMLMLGGIFALISLVALFVVAIKKLYENRAENTANAFAIGLAGFFVIMIAEVALSPGLIFILAGSYYLVPKIIKDSEEYAESMKLPVYR